MHKIFLFKKGLFEEILLKQYQSFNTHELKVLLDTCSGVQLKGNYSLKHCLDKGLDKKTALMVSCAYELGKRIR